MKAQSEVEADKWVSAIRNISQIYQEKDLKDVDISRPWKQSAGVHTTQIVMEEIESR